MVAATSGDVMDHYGIMEFLAIACDGLDTDELEQLAYAIADNPERLLRLMGWEVVDDVQHGPVHGSQP